MIDNDEFFVGNAVHDSHAQRAAAALRTRVHVDLRQQGKGSFNSCWRSRAR